jgi:hypothetical protein
MDELQIIYILTFIVAVIIPLFGVLAKDGAYLYREVKKAMEDGKLTEDEIDRILLGVGRLLRSIVRLIEAIVLKFA